MPVGLQEYGIDRSHQLRTGPKIGIQRVMPAMCGAMGLQIGKNIRTTEGIYGLFGVSYHQTGAGGTGINGIQTGKDPVLHRIGILKFIDQSHRKLLTHHPHQRGSPRPGQGLIQLQQQIIESQLRQTLFFSTVSLAYPKQGVTQ